MTDFFIWLDILTYLACTYFAVDAVVKKDKNTFLVAVIAASCWQMSCSYTYDAKYLPNYTLSTIHKK